MKSIAGTPYMHEDELPPMTDEAYAAWFAHSWILLDGVGCRVGPVVEVWIDPATVDAAFIAWIKNTPGGERFHMVSAWAGWQGAKEAALLKTMDALQAGKGA